MFIVPLQTDGHKRKQIPQMILLSFDGAVNDVNFHLYEEIFERFKSTPSQSAPPRRGYGGRTNPNGCPIKATFFVSHEWTDYGQVQTLYAQGHEVASHSITLVFIDHQSWFDSLPDQVD